MKTLLFSLLYVGFQTISPNEKEANNKELSDDTKVSVSIFNYTNYELENIIYKACEILDIHGVNIIIKTDKIQPVSKDGKLFFYSHAILTADNVNNTFIVTLRTTNLPQRLLIKVILHEMMHVQQIMRKELVAISKLKYMYKGKVIDISKELYKIIPFEKDADDFAYLAYKKYFKEHRNKDIATLSDPVF